MKKVIIVISVTLLTVSSCSLFKSKGGGSWFNAFTIEDDAKLGAQVADEIAKEPQTYPILSESAYPKAYAHIRRITQNILNSGQVYYKDKFKWDVKLIHDDKTLNAFYTPGGYIYVYTGIIKYLDNETQLAGVMGHEIAHADNRHSTEQMTKQYGIEFLLAVLTSGTTQQLAQLASGLLMLKYSRDHETQADEYSVKYLYPTQYDPRGAKYFFEKLMNGGQAGGVPDFLSTHPGPKSRVEEITKVWQTMGGRTDGKTFDAQYLDFKNSLPK